MAHKKSLGWDPVDGKYDLTSAPFENIRLAIGYSNALLPAAAASECSKLEKETSLTG